MLFDAIAYHGYPGGRPVWPFDKIKKPAPAPVVVPAMRNAVAVLRLVADGVNTRRLIAPRLGMKRAESVVGVVAELDRSGYISRTRNDGRSERIISLTSKGRKALEMAR